MKKHRIILPVVAIVFAVASAFAIPNHKRSLAIDVTLDQTECDHDGTCSDIGGSPCKNSSNVQLYERQAGQTCNVPAEGTFAPKM